MLYGIDVSEYQGPIDWSLVNKDFAIIRMTEWRVSRAGNRLDEQVLNNIVKARAFGIPVGGYVRANPTVNTPEIEVSLFMARLDYLGLLHQENTLVPAIDIEPTGDTAADSKVHWSNWVREFINIWNDRTGYARLQYYTSGSYYDKYYGGVVDLSPNVSLWVGHTNIYAPGKPTAEAWAGKTNYTFGGRTLVHQYSHEGSVNGIQGNVDLNVLMGHARLADIMQ